MVKYFTETFEIIVIVAVIGIVMAEFVDYEAEETYQSEEDDELYLSNVTETPTTSKTHEQMSAQAAAKPKKKRLARLPSSDDEHFETVKVDEGGVATVRPNAKHSQQTKSLKKVKAVNVDEMGEKEEEDKEEQEADDEGAENDSQLASGENQWPCLLCDDTLRFIVDSEKDENGKEKEKFRVWYPSKYAFDYFVSMKRFATWYAKLKTSVSEMYKYPSSLPRCNCRLTMKLRWFDKVKPDKPYHDMLMYVCNKPKTLGDKCDKVLLATSCLTKAMKKRIEDAYRHNVLDKTKAEKKHQLHLQHTMREALITEQLC